MGSGPAAGLAEVVLPALQPGSSIMPGKVNPVIPEAVQQVACQVVGNDAAMTFAATLSTFELNTAMPVMARNLLESLRLLANVAPLLADRCLAGLEVDGATMRRYAESSAAVVTALNPVLGYERAAEVAKRAVAERRAVTDIVREEGLVDDETLGRVLDVLAMTKGGVRAAALPSARPNERVPAARAVPASGQGGRPGVSLRIPRSRDDRPRPDHGLGDGIGHVRATAWRSNPRPPPPPGRRRGGRRRPAAARGRAP